MFKKYGIFILSLIFICITLSGCQSLVNDKKMSVSKNHTVTDSVGNKVTLPVKPHINGYSCTGKDRRFDLSF